MFGDRKFSDPLFASSLFPYSSASWILYLHIATNINVSLFKITNKARIFLGSN